MTITTHRNWIVEDIINICASVRSFCGTITQAIQIYDINVTKSPTNCSIEFGLSDCGIHINNIEITFSLVKGHSSGNCIVAQTYRTIGSTKTSSNSTAGISYKVTEQDRLNYISATNEGYSYYVMACITNGDGQTVINPSITTNSITVSSPITHLECVNNVCTKVIGPGSNTCTTQGSTIECTQLPTATHYLDLYLKPYSWYTPGGAADLITTKLGDINGAILNLFQTIGISDYQYISTEVLNETDKPDLVTIRIKLKQLSVMSMAVPLLVYITAIVAALLVIIIIIGVITGWRFTLAGAIGQITGKTYSAEEVTTIVYDDVVKKQLDECDKNYSTPETKNGCVKSVICGASNGLTDALKLIGTDCTSLDINTKIDACLTQYNIDKDITKYNTCTRGVAKAAGDITKTIAPKGTDWANTMLFIGGGLLVGYIGYKLLSSKK